MTNSIIIIPSRLEAKRFPNKPLVKINDVPMIIHVLNRAKESNVGEAFVATPDTKIAEVVKNNGGKVILTSKNHKTGSDRIHEAYVKKLKSKADIIINLQGDMPNIKPDAISKLNEFMKDKNCDIGTLAATCKNQEILNVNVVKVRVDEDLNNRNFVKAKDFFRKAKSLNDKKIYHHIGCYAFTNVSLTRYVKLSRSKKEIERSLEQMRALENNLIIKVGLSKSVPLSVDTEEDLKNIKLEMQ